MATAGWASPGASTRSSTTSSAPARDIVALAHRYHPEGPSPASIATFRRQPRVSFLIRIDAVHDELEDG